MFYLVTKKQEGESDDDVKVLRTVTNMQEYPMIRGLSKRRRRQIIRHLEASELATNIVLTSDLDQLRTLLTDEIDKERESNNGGGGNLGFAFAILSELSQRTLGYRPHPGQIAVAAALCEGDLVEYPTGEGKTLAVAFAAVWLSGVHGVVHVATANDYLAEIGEKSMRPLYNAIGISSGIASENASSEKKRDAHCQRVVYGTLTTFATDFLADQLVTRIDMLIEPRFAAIIIDEADAILVDSATTPIILVGTSKIPVKLERYIETANSMNIGVHYNVDEERRSLWLTKEGKIAAENSLEVTQLYDHPSHVQWLHAALSVAGGVDNSSRLYQEGTHYLVKSGKIQIIDQQGRALENRRFTGGLHPALEAHIGISPSKIPVPVARTSTRSFIKLYNHVCGTAGTLESDAAELQSMYGKNVVVVGPNVPSKRIDHPDKVYATIHAKHKAITAEVLQKHSVGQPVLIGTSSVSDAERISSMLDDVGVKHNLLTARDHVEEAALIAEAGFTGAVTLTAKRAGRGVDIILGGKSGESREEVISSGGLTVILAERFDSRRADIQLRGRSARQGDPGETMTFVSCEDDIVRIFAGAKLDGVLRNVESSDNHEDMRVPGLGSMIERAQRQIEQMNSDIRRSMFSTDDIRSTHTSSFYKWRREILEKRDIPAIILGLYGERFPKGMRFQRKANANPEILAPLWPVGLALPTSTHGEDFLELLARNTWEDLKLRMLPSSDIGSEEVMDATSDALVSAILEIADAEWASYLTAISAIEQNVESNIASIESSIGVAYKDFRNLMAERVLQVVWRAGFTVKQDFDRDSNSPLII